MIPHFRIPLLISKEYMQVPTEIPSSPKWIIIVVWGQVLIKLSRKSLNPQIRKRTKRKTYIAPMVLLKAVGLTTSPQFHLDPCSEENASPKICFCKISFLTILWERAAAATLPLKVVTKTNRRALILESWDPRMKRTFKTCSGFVWFLKMIRSAYGRVSDWFL